MIYKILKTIISALKSQKALAMENLALRQQLAILKSSTKRPRLTKNRSPVLGPPVEDLAGLGSGPHHREARDRYQLARKRLQILLEVEKPTEKQRSSSNQPSPALYP